MGYRALHDGWRVSGADLRDVPATVPGCVHTDLLAAGLIPDPFRDDNESATGDPHGHPRCRLISMWDQLTHRVRSGKVSDMCLSVRVLM